MQVNFLTMNLELFFNQICRLQIRTVVTGSAERRKPCVSDLGLRLASSASLKRARCCKNDKSGRPNNTFTARNHCPNLPTSSLLTQEWLDVSNIFHDFYYCLDSILEQPYP